MVKREDSGTGLRAGFVRGDGLVQPVKNHNLNKAEEPVAKPQPPVPKPPVREPEELTGPTLTLQGVSGKKITGAVKVIKAARPEKPVAPPETVPETKAAEPAEKLVDQPGAPAAEQKSVPPAVAAPPAAGRTDQETPVETPAMAEPLKPAAQAAEPKEPAVPPQTIAAAAAPAGPSAPSAAPAAATAASVSAPISQPPSARPAYDRPQGDRGP
ncbi:MAG TPA: hypothetical protein DD640_06405, partial [Clostridiales bacterium]|nr:hypothetical protein [Clostridiales bacterium]